MTEEAHLMAVSTPSLYEKFWIHHCIFQDSQFLFSIFFCIYFFTIYSLYNVHHCFYLISRPSWLVCKNKNEKKVFNIKPQKTSITTVTKSMRIKVLYTSSSSLGYQKSIILWRLFTVFGCNKPSTLKCFKLVWRIYTI